MRSERHFALRAANTLIAMREHLCDTVVAMIHGDQGSEAGYGEEGDEEPR
jgi:hypothetical protein